MIPVWVLSRSFNENFKVRIDERKHMNKYERTAEGTGSGKNGGPRRK